MKVFIAHSGRDRELVTHIATHLREDKHDVFLATEMAIGGNLLSEISAAIRSADVLVAVIAAGNPNVFYELGLAAGAGVPTLITAPAGESLPGDLASVPYVQLTGDTLRDAQTIARRTSDLRPVSQTMRANCGSAEAALKEATSDSSFLESLRPVDFERLVMELFRERGYAVTATHSAQERGVDFVIKSRDKEIVVEVKKLNRQSRVSVGAVRQLLSTVSTLGAPLGLLVSTSGYTAAALALAAAAGTPILLRTLEEILAAKSEKELFDWPPELSQSESTLR